MLSFVSPLKSLVSRLGSGVARAAPSFDFSEDINTAVRRDMASDFWAMADDWQTVGKDLNKAVQQVVVQVDAKTPLKVIDKSSEQEVVFVDAKTPLKIIDKATKQVVAQVAIERVLKIVDESNERAVAQVDFKKISKIIDALEPSSCKNGIE